MVGYISRSHQEREIEEMDGEHLEWNNKLIWRKRNMEEKVIWRKYILYLDSTSSSHTSYIHLLYFLEFLLVAYSLVTEISSVNNGSFFKT